MPQHYSVCMIVYRVGRICIHISQEIFNIILMKREKVQTQVDAQGMTEVSKDQRESVWPYNTKANKAKAVLDNLANICYLKYSLKYELP